MTLASFIEEKLNNNVAPHTQQKEGNSHKQIREENNLPNPRTVIKYNSLQNIT